MNRWPLTSSEILTGNSLAGPPSSRYSGLKGSCLHALLPSRSLGVALAVPLAAEQRGEAKEQVEFGIQVAQRGLWREAIYRWERATQLDPTYAAAFNNLAIAYEHEGELDKARGAYEKAVEPRTQQRDDQAELRSVQGNQ